MATEGGGQHSTAGRRIPRQHAVVRRGNHGTDTAADPPPQTPWLQRPFATFPPRDARQPHPPGALHPGWAPARSRNEPTTRSPIPVSVAPGFVIPVPHHAVHTKQVYRTRVHGTRWELKFDRNGTLKTACRS